MKSPFKRKTKRQKKLIRFGEHGIAQVRYTGQLPVQFWGRVTGRLYVWNERHPVVQVDKRDLPGLAEDGGRENFEGLPQPEPKPKPKKAELMEVENARLDNDG